MDIYLAKNELEKLKDTPKYESMLKVAGIITLLLEKYNIKPIIVGGLSVEIYTQQEYTTRDIDFVSDGYERIQEILLSLDFKKEGKNFYHNAIEIAIEIPDNYLAGSYDKVIKLELDEGYYVYLISIEDIILDRLRAGIYWKSEEDEIWAFKLLASHYPQTDLDYLKENAETKEEKALLDEWFCQLNKTSP